MQGFGAIGGLTIAVVGMVGEANRMQGDAGSAQIELFADGFPGRGQQVVGAGGR